MSKLIFEKSKSTQIICSDIYLKIWHGEDESLNYNWIKDKFVWKSIVIQFDMLNWDLEQYDKLLANQIDKNEIVKVMMKKYNTT